MTNFNIHEVRQPTVERVTRNGREYLSFPLVPLREMVYDYPEEGTRELLPSDHIAESVDAWAGTPVTAVHPPDRGMGQTVRNADAFTEDVIGEMHDPELVNGGEKLRGHALIDIEKARDIGGIAADVVDRLDAGEELSVSPGYVTVGDEYRAGRHNGEEYDLVQGVPVPDHVAVFPSDEFQARCPPEQGCAAPRLHTVDGDDAGSMTGSQQPPEAIRESDRRRLGSLILHALGFDSDCECDDESDGCGCDSGSAETGDDGDDDDVGGDDDVGAEGGDNGSGVTDNDTTSSTTMTDDERIERLAEDTVFSEETLAAMSDDELASVEGDLDDDADAQTETTESPDGIDDDVDVAELKANYADLAEEVERLKTERDRAEKRDDVRVVTNALDIDEEKAFEMDDDVLSTLADEHRGATETGTTVNYGGMPGSVDRTPESDDGSDDYPAAGRAAYESRKED